MFSTFFISKFDIGLQSHKMLECENFGGHHLHIKMVHNFELELFTVVSFHYGCCNYFQHSQYSLMCSIMDNHGKHS